MEHNQITPEWIAEMRKVCEAATPGPWNASDYASVLAFTDAEVCQRANDNDMAFIAAARTALPAALDALEAAQKEIARLTAERDAAVHDLNFDCNTCKNNGVFPIEQCEKCGTTDDETNGLISYYEWRGLCAENATEGGK